MKINELPNSNEILKSRFELSEIRSKLSGALKDEYIRTHLREIGLFELLLCLANEINDLKVRNEIEYED